MKRNVISIILILLLSSIVNAQNLDVEWVAKNTRPDADTYIEKLITVKNGFIALRGKEPMMTLGYTKLFLQQYDNNFKPGILKEIPFRLLKDPSPDNRKTPTIFFMGQMAEDIYIFTSASNNETNNHTILVKKIDPETLTIDQEGIKLFDVTISDKEFKRSDKYFHIVPSSDASCFLALFDFPTRNEIKKKYIVYVFNNKFQQMWKKEVTLDINSETVGLNSCCIDNKGNVAISSRHYTGKSSGNKKNNFEYILTNIQANGELSESKLSIAGIFLTRLVHKFDNNGKIVCAGFYSAPSTSVFKGIYSIQIDMAKSSIINTNFKPFNSDFNKLMLSEEFKEFKPSDSDALDDYGLIIDELTVQKNGNIKLIAEQKIAYLYNSRTGENSVNRSLDNILCASINNTGNIQWISIIPKYQGVGQGYTSYCMKISNDKLYFLYNEDMEHYVNNKPAYFGYYTTKKFVTVLTSIDENGKLTSDKLWDPVVDKVVLIPASCTMTDDKVMILEARKAKNEYFGRVTFK